MLTLETPKIALASLHFVSKILSRSDYRAILEFRTDTLFMNDCIEIDRISENKQIRRNLLKMSFIRLLSGKIIINILDFTLHSK